MSDYNKYGFGKDGDIDPNRRLVGKMVHMMSMGGGGDVSWRDFADNMYHQMNKQGFFTGGKDGKKGGKDGGSPNLVYNPRTGAFEPVAAASPKQNEGVLAQAMAEQQPSAAMYQPIQTTVMTPPAAPNAVPLNFNQYLQRYLDPRYRGGV